MSVAFLEQCDIMNNELVTCQALDWIHVTSRVNSKKKNRRFLHETGNILTNGGVF